MPRKIMAFALLAALPTLASAATYDCSVKRIDPKSPGAASVWSGKVVLKDGAPDAQIFIIDKDGSGISLTDIVKNASDDAAIRKTLRSYEGYPVIGLRKQAVSLDLNLGHVDTANKKDPAPMDTDAWASPETKMIAVTDVRAGLAASCRLKK